MSDREFDDLEDDENEEARDINPEEEDEVDDEEENDDEEEDGDEEGDMM